MSLNFSGEVGAGNMRSSTVHTYMELNAIGLSEVTEAGVHLEKRLRTETQDTPLLKGKCSFYILNLQK